MAEYLLRRESADGHDDSSTHGKPSHAQHRPILALPHLRPWGPTFRQRTDMTQTILLQGVSRCVINKFPKK